MNGRFNFPTRILQDALHEIHTDEATEWLMRRYYRNDDIARIDALLRMVSYSMREAEQIEEAAKRENLRLRLVAASQKGLVPVDVWQMDCDCATGSHLVWIEPTLEAWETLWDDVHDNAEGPVRITIIPLEDWPSYEPQATRDLALEAFENGHPHYIGGVS